jgi:hypothetical protein
LVYKYTIITYIFLLLLHKSIICTRTRYAIWLCAVIIFSSNNQIRCITLTFYFSHEQTHVWNKLVYKYTIITYIFLLLLHKSIICTRTRCTIWLCDMIIFSSHNKYVALPSRFTFSHKQTRYIVLYRKKVY